VRKSVQSHADICVPKTYLNNFWMDALLKQERCRLLMEIIRTCTSWLVTGVVKMDGWRGEALLQAG
jgi:hypothetical protein